MGKPRALVWRWNYSIYRIRLFPITQFAPPTSILIYLDDLTKSNDSFLISNKERKKLKLTIFALPIVDCLGWCFNIAHKCYINSQRCTDQHIRHLYQWVNWKIKSKRNFVKCKARVFRRVANIRKVPQTPVLSIEVLKIVSKPHLTIPVESFYSLPITIDYYNFWYRK